VGIDGSTCSSRHASVSMPVRPSMRSNRAQSLPMPIEVKSQMMNIVEYICHNIATNLNLPRLAVRLYKLQIPKRQTMSPANRWQCNSSKCAPL
jgi:hypothetical protein